MKYKFYNRLLLLLLMGIAPNLFLLNETAAQSSENNWNCTSCNDGNPCTVDYCVYGTCVNVPIRNCGNDADCELKIVQVQALNCYYDPYDHKSKVKLRVCLWWRNAPTNKNIRIWTGNQQKILDINSARGGAIIEFVLPADGSQNNKVWAEFMGQNSCSDYKTYHLPPACTPAAPCDLDITSVTVGQCYYDAASQKSKSNLEVCVQWKNRPVNQVIFVYLENQTQVIYTGHNVNGSKCLTFTVDADGSANNGIWASFPYGYNCRDEAKYNARQPCYQPPACDLDISDVDVSECYYDPYDNSSKARVNICVNWENRPANDNIVVQISGQSQIIYPSTSNGTECVEFTIPANGTSNNGIWAKFQNKPSCQDEAFYKSPAPCPPNCELDITGVSVGQCYFDHHDYQSKAELTICFKWNNRPANENIMISIAGQTKTFPVSTSSGTGCVKFVIPANGSTHNGIWAKFQYSPHCQDESKYHAPQPCQPTPQCDLDITSVHVSNCYFDTYDNKSKAKLTICVKWKNRPGNENILVSINGQSRTISTTTTDGSKCVEFIIPANGVYNNGIWAKFQYTSSCQDEAKYHAPQPCYQAPQCDLDITNVYVSNCWFDYNDHKSKAKLTVCVKWQNRPANERIYVTINGQARILYVNTNSGSVCVDFIIPANGSNNNGIWAKFEHTQNCQDEAHYRSPQPCQPAPQCDLDIYKVEVSNCYSNYSNHQSEAKVLVCFNWKNRPGNEHIMVSLGGQTKTFPVTTTNGTGCLEFIVPANGSQNNGIWAKFQYSSNCQDEAKYHAPQPCYQPPVCDLDITSVTVSNCYYDHTDHKSKAKLTICVKWQNRPGNENIMVSINGQTITFNPGSNSGSKCVEFIIPANGTQHNGIWAKFQYTPSCQDEAKYHAPQSCYEAPPCYLDIKNVSVSDCYYDHYSNQSKAKVTVCVEYKNRPGSENILVSAVGQTKTIHPTGTNGYQCVEFTTTANGSSNNGIWAKFQYTASCQDEAKFHLPQPCYQQLVCDLDIKRVSVGSCYYDGYSSKAEIEICVDWKNRPANERIMISTSGQSKFITPTTNNGSACVKFAVPANGVYSNGIWAKFEYSQNCQDEAFYHAPQPCHQPAVCKLDIYKVEVGQCYFNHNNYKSEATLKVCLEWKNAPAGEKIKLTTGNQGKLIAFSGSNGYVCVEFTVAANGVHNNGIWAKFEYTQSCQDEAFYNAPYPCSSANTNARAADTNLPIAVEAAPLTNRTAIAPAATSVNDEGVSITELPVVELETKTAAAPVADLRIFPNPARHELNVDVTAFIGKKANVQIFNTIGQVLYQTTIDEISTDKLQLDVSQLPGEVYFLKVQIPNEGTFTKRFVVSK